MSALGMAAFKRPFGIIMTSVGVISFITTILGLLPMVTGVSFDFHRLAVSWVSESSQWWQSMAVVVVFGLMVATFLTLLVVPIYLFLDDLSVMKKTHSSVSNSSPADSWQHLIQPQKTKWGIGCF